jgi:hypothetical protein
VTRIAVGVALLALAAAAVLGGWRFTELLVRSGAPAPQRSLRGGVGGTQAISSRPLRVVVIDGLSRADAPRIGSLAQLCGEGAFLHVDVGFPTKSLPVQRVLWTGLTQQQLGDRGDNDEVPPPPGSFAAAARGVAVAEAYGLIARSVGFVEVAPPREADTAETRADPAAVTAWREHGFEQAAVAAVASPARLVMIHVLAVDEAAHAHGRRGAAYDAALARADHVLATIRAAAPDAQWLVLADHGHVAAGGHGDVEDEVRRVLACWSPAPPGVGADALGAGVHLVDVARWIADALGVPRDGLSVARSLAVAADHPDRDATLPRPSALAIAGALLLVVVGLAGAIGSSRTRYAALWPLAVAAVLVLVWGVPSLSAGPPSGVLAGLGALGAIAAYGLETGVPRRSTGVPPGGRTWGGTGATACVATCLAAIAALVGALLVLTGVPGALLGGPPARLPQWTALLAASSRILVGAAAGCGIALVLDGIYAELRRRR